MHSGQGGQLALHVIQCCRSSALYGMLMPLLREAVAYKSYVAFPMLDVQSLCLCSPVSPAQSASHCNQSHSRYCKLPIQSSLIIQAIDMPSFKSLLLLAASAAALVVPKDGDANVPRKVTKAPATTAAPSLSVHCDAQWCDGSTSWCLYWAGVTSYNPSLGPIPGEVATQIGTCTANVPAATTTVTP